MLSYELFVKTSSYRPKMEEEIKSKSPFRYINNNRISEQFHSQRWWWGIGLMF